jgi:hypothetical protein
MTDREEFEKLCKRLYVLAEKMGMQLTMTLRRKNPFEIAPIAGNQKAGLPAGAGVSRRREPGEE